MKIGIFPMKALPPHRGHLYAIIQASTLVDKLYVVVCDDRNSYPQKCTNMKYIPLMERVKVLSIETSNLPHIKVLGFDETEVSKGKWDFEWAEAFEQFLPEKPNYFLGGEPEYREYYEQYFPGTKYLCLDERDRFHISATMIRNNPKKYWDYVLGSVRPFFAKRVLIAGTESCGKTTLTKNLAKIYNTSWSEEAGRYYADKYLGANEDIFTDKDFLGIAIEQYQEDEKTLRASNKIAFFDTDTVVTQYYAEMFLGHKIDALEQFIDNTKYDLVIILKPDVTWVGDGKRRNPDQERRERLHKELVQMYIDRDFPIIEIGGNYRDRLRTVMGIVDNLIDDTDNDTSFNVINQEQEFNHSIASLGNPMIFNPKGE